MVNEEKVSIIYKGNDRVTTFDYPYELGSGDDIEVYITKNGQVKKLNKSEYHFTPQTKRIDYPLNGSPLATGEVLLVNRHTERSNLVSLPDQSPFDDIERQLDKTMRVIQEIEGRTVGQPISVLSNNFNGVIPNGRPYAFIRFNEKADGFEIVDNPFDKGEVQLREIEKVKDRIDNILEHVDDTRTEVLHIKSDITDKISAFEGNANTALNVAKVRLREVGETETARVRDAVAESKKKIDDSLAVLDVAIHKADEVKAQIVGAEQSAERARVYAEQANDTLNNLATQNEALKSIQKDVHQEAEKTIALNRESRDLMAKSESMMKQGQAYVNNCNDIAQDVASKLRQVIAHEATAKGQADRATEQAEIAKRYAEQTKAISGGDYLTETAANELYLHKSEKITKEDIKAMTVGSIEGKHGDVDLVHLLYRYGDNYDFTTKTGSDLNEAGYFMSYIVSDDIVSRAKIPDNNIGIITNIPFGAHTTLYYKSNQGKIFWKDVGRDQTAQQVDWIPFTLKGDNIVNSIDGKTGETSLNEIMIRTNVNMTTMTGGDLAKLGHCKIIEMSETPEKYGFPAKYNVVTNIPVAHDNTDNGVIQLDICAYGAMYYRYVPYNKKSADVGWDMLVTKYVSDNNYISKTTTDNQFIHGGLHVMKSISTSSSIYMDKSQIDNSNDTSVINIGWAKDNTVTSFDGSRGDVKFHNYLTRYGIIKIDGKSGYDLASLGTFRAYWGSETGKYCTGLSPWSSILTFKDSIGDDNNGDSWQLGFDHGNGGFTSTLKIRHLVGSNKDVKDVPWTTLATAKMLEAYLPLTGGTVKGLKVPDSATSTNDDTVLNARTTQHIIQAVATALGGNITSLQALVEQLKKDVAKLEDNSDKIKISEGDTGYITWKATPTLTLALMWVTVSFHRSREYGYIPDLPAWPVAYTRPLIHTLNIPDPESKDNKVMMVAIV